MENVRNLGYQLFEAIGKKKQKFENYCKFKILKYSNILNILKLSEISNRVLMCGGLMRQLT